MDDNIGQILDKIDGNQIFVPAFQREYVWKRGRVKELFKSLLKQYPTGTLLTWETSVPPELKGKTKYNSSMGSIKLLLDGQQRITSIYLIMRGEIPPYYTQDDILTDVSNLHINLDTLELEYYKITKMKNNPLWVNLTNIFTNKIDSVDIIENLDDKEQIKKIISNFNQIKNIKNIKFPEQTIPIRANIKEAINIFYLVNSMGVNLTEAELALAQISGYWPEARKLIKKTLKRLKDVNFNFKLDFIIYVLLGIIHNKGTEMQKLHHPSNLNKLKEVWEELDGNILDYTINILKTNYVENSREINSIYALVPIMAYIYKKKKLSEIEIKKMVKWFYFSQVRQRYISQLPQKLTKDLTTLNNSIENKQNPFDNLLHAIKEERNLEISNYEFVGATTSSSLFNLMKFYFRSKNALCLGTGVKISGFNTGKRYSLENDHIFPFSSLKERGYKLKTPKYSLAQEITNRAIVTQKENRTKSNKSAYDYLMEIKQKHPNALKLQLIPENEELWKIENYEEFLKERRKLLTKELNCFLNEITQTEENEIKISTEDLIKQEENENLEFKSTLSWNLKSQSKNDIPENAVLKTIAGFNNYEGGTLIIGVEEDHETKEHIIHGLDDDYNLANLKNRDKFELHLRNLIKGRLKIDTGYIARKIKISFENVEENDICIVEVESGDAPLFTKDEKFYLRSGNSTQEVKPSEISNYIKNRF